MQIYTEKEQAKQGKIQNADFKAKGGIWKYNRANSSAPEDKKFNRKPVPKWNKRSGDLRERAYSAKLSTCEKELKKSLGPGFWGSYL